jgi:hypothetical protein
MTGKNKIKGNVLGMNRHRLHQNIILIHMMNEQNGDFPPDKLMELWSERKSYNVANWKDQSFMNLPKTSTQLFHEIKKRGYGISKSTIKQCLDELVELRVLMRFPGRDRQYNQVFYVLPWAIDDGDYYQRRRYYIPWALAIPPSD